MQVLRNSPQKSTSPEKIGKIPLLIALQRSLRGALLALALSGCSSPSSPMLKNADQAQQAKVRVSPALQHTPPREVEVGSGSNCPSEEPDVDGFSVPAAGFATSSRFFNASFPVSQHVEPVSPIPFPDTNENDADPSESVAPAHSAHESSTPSLTPAPMRASTAAAIRTASEHTSPDQWRQAPEIIIRELNYFYAVMAFFSLLAAGTIAHDRINARKVRSIMAELEQRRSQHGGL
ncbi:MAG: hypothetical protein AB7J40_06225 [Candidatus Altimarinota bacterium]